jgi:hypothetical protein
MYVALDREWALVLQFNPRLINSTFQLHTSGYFTSFSTGYWRCRVAFAFFAQKAFVIATSKWTTRWRRLDALTYCFINLQRRKLAPTAAIPNNMNNSEQDRDPATATSILHSLVTLDMKSLEFSGTLSSVLCSKEFPAFASCLCDHECVMLIDFLDMERKILLSWCLTSWLNFRH